MLVQLADQPFTSTNQLVQVAIMLESIKPAMGELYPGLFVVSNEGRSVFPVYDASTGKPISSCCFVLGRKTGIVRLGRPFPGDGWGIRYYDGVTSNAVKVNFSEVPLADRQRSFDRTFLSAVLELMEASVYSGAERALWGQSNGSAPKPDAAA